MSIKQLVLTAAAIDPSGAVGRSVIKMYMLMRYVFSPGPAAGIMKFRGIDEPDFKAITKPGPHGAYDSIGITLPNPAYERWAFRYSPAHTTFILHSGRDWAGAVARVKGYTISVSAASRAGCVWNGWQHDMMCRYLFTYQSHGAEADDRVAQSMINIANAADDAGDGIDTHFIRWKIRDTQYTAVIFANLARIAVRRGRTRDIFHLAAAIAVDETRCAPAHQTYLAAANEFLEMNPYF